MTSLVAVPLLLSRIKDGRCLKGNEILDVDEYVYCRNCCPSVYDDGLSNQDKGSVARVVDSLLSDRLAVVKALNGDPLVYERLDGFFGAIIRKGSASLEEFVHAYIYLFWERLSFQQMSLSPKGSIYWLGKGGPKSGIPDLTVVDKAVLRLRAEKIEVDLVAVDSESQTLWLVEIKRAELDDRAVGQMIRYFDRANYCLHTREFRAANINYVRPVLILETVEFSKWFSIPMHFRDLLEIVSFAKTPVRSGSIVLNGQRRQLLSGLA